MNRSAGVLMHVSSLPSNYGIGTFGKEAYAFIDFLKEAGQTYWQMLPLHPTGFGNSPYQALSSFAGNPYLIDLDMLIEDGLLKKEEVEDIYWYTIEEINNLIQKNEFYDKQIEAFKIFEKYIKEEI